MKKPSDNVGTRTCVAGISSQQKCYIPSTIIHPQKRMYDGRGDIAFLLTTDTGDACTSPHVARRFFQWYSMTNIAIYIIKALLLLSINCLWKVRLYSLTDYLPNYFFRRFSGHSIRWVILVYRLIVATLIGKYFDDNSLNWIPERPINRTMTGIGLKINLYGTAFCFLFCQ